MRNSLVAVVGLLALTSIASTGCAGETDTPEVVDEASEDALTSRQLPGAAAVEIATVRGQTTVLSKVTLGAPKKVKSILSSVKKLKPTDPAPRCMERDTTRLTFLDGAGKKLATVDTTCGGFGSIGFESGQTGYGVRFNTATVDAAKSAPFAVGDALWGISKIELVKRMGNEKRTVNGDAMKPILDGFDLDAVPDPHASVARCMPTYGINMKRGNGNVAYASFFCGAANAATAPASTTATFEARQPGTSANADPLASGAISLDPRPIVRAFE